MRKLSMMLVLGIAFSLLFSLNVGKVCAQEKTWTASIWFPFRTKTVVVNPQNIEVFQESVALFKGTIDLFTDPAGDPVKDATSGCYISFSGKLGGTEDVNICISDLVQISLDRSWGERALALGTGTFTDGSNTGLVFFETEWGQKDNPPGTPIKIGLEGKMRGGSAGGNFLFGAPRKKLDKFIRTCRIL